MSDYGERAGRLVSVGDDFLTGVEHGRRQAEELQLRQQLAADEAYARRRVARAVAVERRQGRVRLIAACLLTAIVIYNVTLHGIGVG